jgi:HKD family nuclease
MATVSFRREDPRDGTTALYHALNRYLRDPGLIKVRVAVGYARWSGFTLIARALEGFLDREGKLEALFGYDNGVTTADALHYAYSLRRRYGAAVFAGVIQWDYSNSIFHPKCFDFTSATQRRILVGSANLTRGGLMANHELSIEVLAAASSPEIIAFDPDWKNYRKLATSIEPNLIRKLERSQKLSSERKLENSGKAKPYYPLGRAYGAGPLIKHLQKTTKPRVRRALLEQADTISEKPTRLYQQVLGETGPGGTQMQFPAAAAGAFFGVAPEEQRRGTFLFPGDEVPATIAHYPNKTNRIALRTLAGVPRPAIIVFQRVGPDRYRCRIIRRTDADYASTLRDKCTEQTRNGSRRWGLA